MHRGPDATGHNYSRSLVDTGVRPWRDDIKPLHVVQPEVGGGGKGGKSGGNGVRAAD